MDTIKAHAQTSIPPFPALLANVRQHTDSNGNLVIGCVRNWIRLRSSDAQINGLLDLLDGSRSVGEIVTMAKSKIPGIRDHQVLHLLEALARNGLLMMGKQGASPTLHNDSYLERHARDLEFYSLFESDGVSRYDRLTALHDAKAVVVGMGGAGSFTSLALACAGIGTLVALDFDRVELTNLSRQMLYTSADIGQLKVEAARVFFRRFTPEMDFVPSSLQVRGPDDLRPFLQDADIVVVAADWPPRVIARWLNEACAAAGVPSIYMSTTLTYVLIGPLVVPGVTCCFECLCTMRGKNMPQDWFENAVRARWGKPFPTVSPVPATIGNIMAWEIITWLTKIHTPRSLGALLRFDLQTMEVSSFPVTRDPVCPICQQSMAREDE